MAMQEGRTDATGAPAAGASAGEPDSSEYGKKQPISVAIMGAGLKAVIEAREAGNVREAGDPRETDDAQRRKDRSHG